MKRFVPALCIIIFLLSSVGTFIQLGPLRTVLDIRKSFRTGDMELLNNSINFEAVRDSVKSQMLHYLNEKDFIESEDPFLKSLFSSFSYSFVDGMVEEYLQPNKVQSLFDFTERVVDTSLVDESQERLLNGDNIEKNWFVLAKEYQALCKFKYTSWSEFEFSLKESIKEPISLALFAGTCVKFQRNGLDWKVYDIIFPESFFENKLR